MKEEVIRECVVMKRKIPFHINAKLIMTVPLEDNASVINVQVIWNAQTLQHLLIKLLIRSKLLKLAKEELILKNVVMNQKIN